jgi:hypothetical protein
MIAFCHTGISEISITIFCLVALQITAAFGLSSNDDWNTLKAAHWFALGGIGVAGAVFAMISAGAATSADLR